MNEKFKELLSYNKKYWYGYQSPLTCLLGSDGVGHDNIHPMDQFQAACRNASTLHDAITHMREELELKQIDLDEATHRASALNGYEARRNAVKQARAARSVEGLRIQISEREEAFDVFYRHAKSLLPYIQSRYDHIDQALPEAWAARVAYNAQVRNSPLGQDFKVALMTEEQKRLLHTALKLPEEIHMPDAAAVMRAVENISQTLRQLPSTNAAIEYEGAD